MDPVKHTYKLAKRIAIAVIGVSVLAVGIVMIITPGPALVLIPVGLAILGLEFAWARLWLRRLREGISSEIWRHVASRRRITAGAIWSNGKKEGAFDTRFIERSPAPEKGDSRKKASGEKCLASLLIASMVGTA